MAQKKPKPPLRQRIVNSVGLQTGDQVAVEIARQVSKANRKSERRIKKLNAKHEEQTLRAAEAAYISGYDDGNDDPASGDIAAGGMGYRVASGGVREPFISWEQNLQSAWQLKQSNPLVNRAGQIKTHYIVGPGIEPKAADPDLQTILTDFWVDNTMGSYVPELTRQWIDYGAQCVPAFVRDTDGRVRLGYIDPDLIERVVAHPGNSREMWAVVVKEQHNLDPWIENTGKQTYRIVRKAERVVVEETQRFRLNHREECKCEAETTPDFGDDYRQTCPDCGVELFAQFSARVIEAHYLKPGEPDDAKPADISGKMAIAQQSPREPWEDVMLAHYGLDDYTGDCFYVRKNADSNQTLGRSDHLQVADTCDQHDAAAFAVGEREQLANLIFADVAIDAEGQNLADRIKELGDSPPKPGSINAHNLSETWNLNSPTLNQTASVATVDMQRKLVLGGEGIPDAWFGSPSGAHLATAQAQGDPTWRTFSHDQGLIQTWFLEMLAFVRDQAIIAGTYTPEPTVEKTIDADGKEVEVEVEPDTSVALPMPEMTVKDVTGLATALGAVVGALSLAEDRGYISKDDGIDAVAKVLAELDVRPDVDELKDAAVNDAQGAKLGIGAGDAALNRQSFFNTHGALGDE